jgi:diamine N-acetyltransferase
VSQVVDVSLVDVDALNWQACAALRVEDGQRRWVADVTYYLCLCAYGDTWHPLAIEVENEVLGFLMWGIDDDDSRWIGGLVVDAAHQGRGVGTAAVIEATRVLIAQPGCAGIALSCNPLNEAARSFYAGLGFLETGETAEDGAELVSRLGLSEAREPVAINSPAL